MCGMSSRRPYGHTQSTKGHQRPLSVPDVRESRLFFGGVLSDVCHGPHPRRGCVHLVGHSCPAEAKAPRLHWALHNIGVVVMTGALFMELRGPGEGPWGAFIPLGGLLVFLAAMWLTIMLWPRLGAR